MAITQTLTTSFKKALLDGEMDFSSDTSQAFKIALYTNLAELDASTTQFTDTNEVSVTDTNYVAGGNTLTPTVSTSGTTAFLDFADTSWSDATFTARGALIYKSGGTSPSIAVLDFGSDKTVTSGTFTVTFPTNDATNAIIRIE